MNFIAIFTLTFALTNAVPHELLTVPSHPSLLLPATLPLELTHHKTLNKETQILNAGKKLSEAITAGIVSPVIYFNSKVAAAAGALPPLLAAKGAVLGAAIATPLEVGAVASSSIVSGLTGKLVSIPITLATGATAKLVGVIETGKEIWDEKVEVGAKIFKDGLIKVGTFVLKPIAIIVGTQTALTGAGLGIAGSGLQGVGLGLQAAGAKMALTGVKAKGIGSLLIGWAAEPVFNAKLVGAKLLGSKIVGPQLLNPLQVKGFTSLLHGLTSHHGIASKDLGSRIHLPLLQELLSHDVKSH